MLIFTCTLRAARNCGMWTHPEVYVLRQSPEVLGAIRRLLLLGAIRRLLLLSRYNKANQIMH